jgi:hypothetical protein
MIVEESTWTYVGGSRLERRRPKWGGEHSKESCGNIMRVRGLD